ncbi:MAG: hypothetical protein H6824_10585 [Planctomycetaceae bacterium]|nr:hypothetical protein [Planctomycetaceae bacterium]
MTISERQRFAILIRGQDALPPGVTREELAELLFDATARLAHLECHEQQLLNSVNALRKDLSEIDDNAVYMESVSGYVYRHETLKITPKRVVVRATEGPMDYQNQAVQLDRQELEAKGHTAQRQKWFNTYRLGWFYRQILGRQLEQKKAERRQVTENILSYRTNRDIWFGVPVSDDEWQTICGLVPEKTHRFDGPLDWRECGF